MAIRERFDQAAAALDEQAEEVCGGPVPVGMKAPRRTSLREAEVELTKEKGNAYRDEGNAPGR